MFILVWLHINKVVIRIFSWTSSWKYLYISLYEYFQITQPQYILPQKLFFSNQYIATFFYLILFMWHRCEILYFIFIYQYNVRMFCFVSHKYSSELLHFFFVPFEYICICLALVDQSSKSIFISRKVNNSQKWPKMKNYAKLKVS